VPTERDVSPICPARRGAAPLELRLGLWDVFSIAAGAMISSGLFLLPGIAFARAGPAMILAYLLAGLLVLPAMFAQAELSTAMPRSGGSYFFIERSLGAFAGTLAGLISWLCISLKAAFACVGLGTLALLVCPELGAWGMRAVAAGACLAFTALNLFSVKGTGRLQGLLVALLLAILGVYVAGGLGSVRAARYEPFFTSDWRTFFAVAGMVFISFGGLTKVVDVAEEIREPQRNLPLGLFLSFAVVNLMYAAVIFVTTGVLDGAELSGSLAPLSLGAGVSMGRFGAIAIGVAAFLAYASTGNAGILSASRSPMAMSRDGLLPCALARTSARFGTPWAAILLTATLMLVVILFLSVEELAKTASTMFLISFVLANAGVIVMRRARIPGYRPTFRMPLCPWLPLAGIAVYGFLIADMGWVPLAVTGGFLVAASAWYLAYIRWRIQRESAVVYMVKSALSRHIGRSGLEDELVQIALERDDIEFDRFDRLVQDGVVLDIDEAVSCREMFERLSAALSGRLGMPEKAIYELLLARERESSTVIQTGLAIPHIVVEGAGVFQIALVRCRPGVAFDELHPPVHTMFVLIGSADERSFHLKSLVAVAHIVQEPGFAERWASARGPEQMRDVVILSGRRRMHAG